MNRPEFYIFDREVQPPERPKYQETVDEINRRSGCQALLTEKREMENYIHPDAIKAVCPEVNISFGGFDNVPLKVAKEIHNNSESQKTWDELSGEKKDRKKSQVKKWLNTKAVEKMNPILLNSIDPKGEVKSWLTRIANLIKNS